MQSGVLHSEEKDYKTAYSYFYESFENYSTLESPNAVFALKYMLLCKVMTNNPEDVNSIINSKLKYADKMEAMRAIANSHKHRSLLEFESALRKYKEELTDDPIIHHHLTELYDNLLDQNLCRIIEPYSRVEISQIAKLINLDVNTVEKKLSKMILDKKFRGILDQGAGTLIVFDEVQTNKTYPASLETIQHMSKVVDSLYEKVRRLS